MLARAKWFDCKRGFGFIVAEGYPDIFVHYKDIQCQGFKHLIDGELVEFELVERPNGLGAVNVRRVSPDPAPFKVTPPHAGEAMQGRREKDTLMARRAQLPPGPEPEPF